MRHENPAPLARRSNRNVGQLSPFSAFRQEMDRLFDTFFAPDTFGRAGFADFPFNPALDLTENEKQVQVRAELPGVEEKDIEIRLDGDIVTIRGEKREERRDESEHRRMFERSYGAFERSVRLPFAPDEDDVKADFKNGVLTITAPKPPELARQAKRIPIGRA